MRILPVVREFTGTWVGPHAGERLMLSENEPGKVQVLWKLCVNGKELILTGELTVKAAVASGHLYENGDAEPKPSWWHKLMHLTPKPKPCCTLTAHFINPEDLHVSYRVVGDSPPIGYRMNAEIRTQIGEIDGT